LKWSLQSLINNFGVDLSLSCSCSSKKNVEKFLDELECAFAKAAMKFEEKHEEERD
jgi:hypothetical protein